MPPPSPFLSATATVQKDSLALLHLKRDLFVPTLLRTQDESNSEYAEGGVINTRFGSFPYSTLLDKSWGTQVLASQVDTGSRGRQGSSKKGKKRKRGENEEERGDVEGAIEQMDDAGPNGGVQATLTASSGFAHVIPPTPEGWTISLPHRTQVVYTPDYSYVLQRLQVRPGGTVIEAGAGSGSFTHAAARAVFSGYPQPGTPETHSTREDGRVYSFEYHEPRATQLQKEIREHGLDSIVRITHRDVYEKGFNLERTSNEDRDPATTIEPRANAVFLDLPAPWLALPHLQRSTTPTPLNPSETVHLCTFSPCIEQVQRTYTSLRELGWVEIETVELLHKRIDVRRERVGLQEEGLRGTNASAASVEEALGRLREVEMKFTRHHASLKDKGESAESLSAVKAEEPTENGTSKKDRKTSKQARVEKNKALAESGKRKTWKEGRLVHRTEPELKTHTSYLTFAVLPREWTDEDEAAARKRWGGKASNSTKEERKGEDGDDGVDIGL